MKKDLSISIVKANLYSVIFIIPGILLAFIYFIIWRNNLKAVELQPSVFQRGTFLLAAVLGIVLHELIHGFSWAYFGKKSIETIKFGVYWKKLTPYAHCTEPMEVSAYRLGAMMPGLLLGVFPYLLGVIGGNVLIMFFGLLLTFIAGGDALILWLIRDVKPGQLVEDHPTRAGCYVIETQPE